MSLRDDFVLSFLRYNDSFKNISRLRYKIGYLKIIPSDNAGNHQTILRAVHLSWRLLSLARF